MVARWEVPTYRGPWLPTTSSADDLNLTVLRVSDLRAAIASPALELFVAGAGATVRAPANWPAGRYREYATGTGILERSWMTDGVHAELLEGSR